MNRDVMNISGKNMVYFTRSGYIGDQSFTTVYWPGDQRTDFEIDDGFPNAILTALNISWTGMVMFGSDIAGYLSVGNPPSNRELFYRWTEFGAFSPVMRTHHGSEKDKNWSFDRDSDTLGLYKKYAIIHQKLFPYLYSEAISSGSNGIPLIRQMYMVFNDPELISMDSQYMFGPFMLVAPVMIQGAVTKNVFLPKGSWYDFWTGEKTISEGEWINVYAPIEYIPVFVKAGSVIEQIASDIDTIEAPSEVTDSIVTLEKRNNWREVSVYTGKSVVWEDYESNIFKLEEAFFENFDKNIIVNGEQISECGEGVSETCYFSNNNQVVIRIKSDGKNPVTIESDGKFIIETDKSRIWEIKIYR
jgi:alpha-glucosidase (family GH31 glycosyl hydrolase)